MLCLVLWCVVQACVMGTGNELGSPLRPDAASDAIFGLVLLNDWSARDIQKWEMAPLGPFNGKNWVSTLVDMHIACCFGCVAGVWGLSSCMHCCAAFALLSPLPLPY
mgnify:CR=1 FL=1